MLKKQNKIYYVDIPDSFSKSNITNDLSTVTNVRAVNQSLKNIITTKKGTRPFYPDFGCDITNGLFENMNDLSAYQVERSIREAIENFEPRAILERRNGVEVLPIYDENEYIINVRYRLLTDKKAINKLKLRLRGE